jgi:acyl-CoA synthetase (AMP-forming)/AMP-acid ligase II
MIEVLEAAADSAGEVPAVITGDAAVSFRQLLDSLRPEPGRVLLRLPNGPGWHRAFWQGMAGGAVVAPLSPRAKPEEVDHVTADFLSGPTPPAGVRVVQYTAGTTGRPKGALLRADGLLTVARGHAVSWGLRPGEAIFIPNPASHIMGLVLGCLMPAVARVTVVTMDRFEPGLALELIERHRPVAMAGSPTHYEMLAEHPDLARRDISSLRFGFAGGAASSPDAVRRLTERLGLDAILNGYGMSEACGSISRTEVGDPPEVHSLTAGRPMPWLETRLVQEELLIRGAPVTQGYHGSPEPAVDAEGWFATGDLFEIDSSGRLRFRGRSKDLLTVGGFNVYPAEVERVLAGHPDVLGAQVVGAPDRRLGEVPVAFLQLAPGTRLDEKALRGFCDERLSGYKVPQRFHSIAEFPINSAGKVEKYRLRELVGA